MIWGDISRYVNGENVLGGVAYKNKYIISPLKELILARDRTNHLLEKEVPYILFRFYASQHAIQCSLRLFLPVHLQVDEYCQNDGSQRSCDSKDDYWPHIGRNT